MIHVFDVEKGVLPLGFVCGNANLFLPSSGSKGFLYLLISFVTMARSCSLAFSRLTRFLLIYLIVWFD